MVSYIRIVVVSLNVFTLHLRELKKDDRIELYIRIRSSTLDFAVISCSSGGLDII